MLVVQALSFHKIFGPYEMSSSPVARGESFGIVGVNDPGRVRCFRFSPEFCSPRAEE